MTVQNRALIAMRFENQALDLVIGGIALVALALVVCGAVAMIIENPKLDVAITVIAALALFVCGIIRRRRSRPRGATFVPGHWLLGNLPELWRAATKKLQHETMHQQHQMYGKTFILKWPLSPWTVKTTCPRNVEHILKTNFENYDKGERIRGPLSDLLGRGIFNADGHEWHSQRKIASHMFTASLFKEHIWVVVRRNARKLRDTLEATDPSKPVDVFNLMNRFTLDSMGEIGFGRCIGALEDPTSPFMSSFDKAQEVTFWRFGNPLWRFCRRFGIFKEKDGREHFDSLDAYSRSVVRELCSAIDQGSSKSVGVNWADMEARKSFVGLFLEDARKRGENLSEDFLRDLMMNFLMAGRDHTAQALAWTIFCLCKHPEAEAKARQEVLDVCGVRGPVYEDMPNLPYLQAVINEALRLYPAMPLAAKSAVNDDTLPDGTFVPKGSTVMYDIFSMGRDGDIWGEDADVFRPERWENLKNAPGNFEYLVFSAGPRECLGRRLALIEMKTCLAFLLPQVSFRLAVPAETISADSTLSIGMGRGLPCFVTSAQDKECCDSSASTTLHSECATSVSDWTEAPSEAATEADFWVESQSSSNSNDDESAPQVDVVLEQLKERIAAVERRLRGEDDQSERGQWLENAQLEHRVSELERRINTEELPLMAGPQAADQPSNEDAVVEAVDQPSNGRQRAKKRLGGYARKRRQKFWARVRESTPERWLDE